jgi:hypothetical protein
MANKLFYLMTFLPALPNLGEPLAEEDALARIRDEADENLLLFADLLDTENLIEQTAMQHYVAANSDYRPELPERWPEHFRKTFNRFREISEAEWLNEVFTAWFNLMIELSGQIGSELLANWAKWEFSLRTGLRIERIRQSTSHNQDFSQIIPEFMHDPDFIVDHAAIIESWKGTSDPMQGEKLLDQYRIDYLRSQGTGYSFAIEELVAYMLELRIHNRYARLSLEKGREILEEVTAL